MSEVGDNVHFEIKDALDVLKARREGMQAAQRLGFSLADATKIAVVISELGRNIVNYAGTGTITVLTNPDHMGRKYIKIIADDKGPGIPNIDSALAGGNSTSGGLGLGLSGSKRMMDEFSIRSAAGEGTTIMATKWVN
jgi:serine/threonine-protein kinase RsbT